MTMVPVIGVDVADRSALESHLAAALEGGPAVVPFSSASAAAAAEFLRATPEVASGVALIIRTSGSMGTPKAVALTADALRSSAEATTAYLGGPGQWLVALSPEVIAGTQMLIRSQLANTEPVFVSGHVDPTSFAKAAKTLTHERRYTSLVPTQLAQLLDDRESIGALASFDAVLVGGQATPEQLIERARGLGIRVVRTYGSTETASGCVYEGEPVGDTQLRITDGELWVSGSCLAAGYVGDVELSAERFRTVEGARWFATRDAATFSEGKLLVTGRVDNVFISGGIKVSLDALENTVRAISGWQQAVVVAIADAKWGQRAAVVTQGPAGQLSDLQQLVRAELGVAAVPVAHKQVDEIPLLPSGKPDRGALQKLF